MILYLFVVVVVFVFVVFVSECGLKQEFVKKKNEITLGVFFKTNWDLGYSYWHPSVTAR